MKLDHKSTLRAFGALCAALSIVTGIELFADGGIAQA
jgi:hypothetical protein